MTLTDKLAALPKMPEIGNYLSTADCLAYWYCKANAIQARNALLCDALEALLFHHDAACSSVTACKLANEVSDVLAACEVKHEP